MTIDRDAAIDVRESWEAHSRLRLLRAENRGAADAILDLLGATAAMRFSVYATCQDFADDAVDEDGDGKDVLGPDEAWPEWALILEWLRDRLAADSQDALGATVQRPAASTTATT